MDRIVKNNILIYRNNFKVFENLKICDFHENLIETINVKNTYTDFEFDDYLSFVDGFYNVSESNFLKKYIKKPEINKEEFLKKNFDFNSNSELSIQKFYSIIRNHSESKCEYKPLFLIENDFLIVKEYHYYYKESRDSVELESTEYFNIHFLNLNTLENISFRSKGEYLGTKVLQVSPNLHFELFNFDDNLYISNIVFGEYLFIVQNKNNIAKYIFDYPRVTFSEDKIIRIFKKNTVKSIDVTYLEFLSFIYERLFSVQDYEDSINETLTEFKSNLLWRLP